jgi:hypothetical protein
MELGSARLSGPLQAAAFQCSLLNPNESKISLTHKKKKNHTPSIARGQFVYVVLCGRNKVWSQEATWLCALFQTLSSIQYTQFLLSCEEQSNAGKNRLIYSRADKRSHRPWKTLEDISIPPPSATGAS